MCTTRASVRALALLVLLALGALGAPSLAGAEDGRYRLEVSSHGLTARATLGSFCRTTYNEDGTISGDVCADAAYPLGTRGRVPVHRGGRVHLKTNHPARSMSVTPVHFSKDGERFRYGDRVPARSKGDGGSRWRARLPRRLARRTRVLDVEVRYADGGANFWAGLKVHRRHGD